MRSSSGPVADNGVRDFCTYFDSGYLTRGLALYSSLKAHMPSARLWVLCMDELAHSILTHLDRRDLIPVRLEELEEGDPDFHSVKGTRSRVEYYFTSTPCFPRYLFDRREDIRSLTYLDADLYFYRDPTPLFEEMGGRSIAVIEHRFSNPSTDLPFGRFNVGWVSFVRDDNGLACLAWWRERCLEWCYDRVEPGRYADQKYLDQWPDLFPEVAILRHPGANVAIWNVAATLPTRTGPRLSVGGEELLFYHFHALKRVNRFLYDANLTEHRVPHSRVLRGLYKDYLSALDVGSAEAASAVSKVSLAPAPVPPSVSGDAANAPSTGPTPPARRIARGVLSRARASQRMLTKLAGGDYFFHRTGDEGDAWESFLSNARVGPLR